MGTSPYAPPASKQAKITAVHHLLGLTVSGTSSPRGRLPAQVRAAQEGRAIIPRLAQRGLRPL
jgi:hypothetical protein